MFLNLTLHLALRLEMLLEVNLNQYRKLETLAPSQNKKEIKKSHLSTKFVRRFKLRIL